MCDSNFSIITVTFCLIGKIFLNNWYMLMVLWLTNDWIWNGLLMGQKINRILRDLFWKLGINFYIFIRNRQSQTLCQWANEKLSYIPAVQMGTWKYTWKARKQQIHMTSLTMRYVDKRSNPLLLCQMDPALSWCSAVVSIRDEVSRQITPLKQVCTSMLHIHFFS
jgi:hypothetical protein